VLPEPPVGKICITEGVEVGVVEFLRPEVVVLTRAVDGDEELEDEDVEVECPAVLMQVLQREVEKDSSCVDHKPKTLTFTLFVNPMVSSIPLGHCLSRTFRSRTWSRRDLPGILKLLSS